MAWPSWTGTETTGVDGRVSVGDWDNARKLAAAWDTAALSAGAITVAGDGKYTVTYTGAQNLDTITGTSEGDVVIVRANVTGAGASLTIRNNGGGTGNLRTNAGVNIVLAGDTEWAIFIHVGSVLTGGKFYGP